MTRDQIIAFMIRLEGGEANVAGDPGGHTKFGITQRTLDYLRSQWWQLPANVADLTAEQATAVYERVEWADIHGDDLPTPLACLMMNAAVNEGEPTAIRMLQECVGEVADGILGPKTLEAVKTWHSRYMPEQTLVEEFAARVGAKYAQLYGTEAKFELGWFRRLFRVYTLAVNS